MRQSCREQSRCACRNCRRGFGWVELLVIIAILALLVSFLLPSLCRSSETANRVKCASNLRQIGQAILIYSNDNRGALPRTRTSAGPLRTPVWGACAASTQPFADDGPAENDVTAAFFLLLRTQDVTSEVFTCPSSNAEKDLYGGGTNAPVNRSNFTDVKKNLSYSYQNPYPSDLPMVDRHSVGAIPSDYAIAADINPGTAPSSADNVLATTQTSSAKDMKLGNSNNHDKDGQNILYHDGHVAWESNRFAGDNRDNIYTAGDGKVIASPTSLWDSVLLPTDD
jgi:prepilin-type processing-associated H-X9-DG protein